MSNNHLAVREQQQTFDASSEFQHLFHLLLQQRDLSRLPAEDRQLHATEVEEQLLNTLKSNAQQLHGLRCYPTYSRHIIGRHDSWIGLICRWQSDVRSSIHGHPAFTYYFVVEGEFTMEIYRKNKFGEIQLDKISTMSAGESIWEYGNEGQYDNLIHRVNSRQSGFTLQLFSEDPALGEVYPEVHSAPVSIYKGYRR